MATPIWKEMGYKNAGSYNRAVDPTTGKAPSLVTPVSPATAAPDVKQLESTIKSGNFSASDARAYNKATGNQQGARELALGSQKAVNNMQTSVTADEFKGMQNAGIKTSANIGKGITADLQGGTTDQFKQNVQSPAVEQKVTITNGVASDGKAHLEGTNYQDLINKGYTPEQIQNAINKGEALPGQKVDNTMGGRISGQQGISTEKATQAPKPTNLGAIRGKNIISETPTYKGADGQTYKTVRFEDQTLGTVKVDPETGTSQLVGSTYSDDKRQEARQIVEQGLNDAGNIFKQIQAGASLPEVVKNTKQYSQAQARLDVANKYKNLTEEQLYNAYINGDIGQQLEQDIASNPYLKRAKERYNKKLVTDNINKEAVNTLNAYNKANGKTITTETPKTALETINDKKVSLFTNMGKTEDDLVKFRDYMKTNYPELEAQTTELNAKNMQLRQLTDERDARLDEIIKENPGISINRATMLAARQNKDTNKQIQSMTYELANLSANIKYQTDMADKEYGYEQKRQERRDALEKEQRGYAFDYLKTQEQRAYEEQARTRKLEQQYQYQYGDLNSTNPTLQNIAVERAVADMYNKYPIPGMESQSAKVQKVKDYMSGAKTGTPMTGSEAIASVENEIRNSQRYQDYLASEKAKMTPKVTESWQKLTDGSLYNQATGEIKSVSGTTANTTPLTNPNSIIDYSQNLRGKTNLQCGELVNDYVKQVTGKKGIAGNDYGTKIQNIQTIGEVNSPVQGGIFAFNSSDGVGHTGIVQSVNSDGSISVLEANRENSKTGSVPKVDTYTAQQVAKMRFSQAPGSKTGNTNAQNGDIATIGQYLKDNQSRGPGYSNDDVIAFNEKIDRFLKNGDEKQMALAFRKNLIEQDVDFKKAIDDTKKFQTGLTQVEKLISDYEKAGKDTNALKAMAEKIARATGLTTDTALAQMQTQMGFTLANYIKSISGTARSDAEVQRLMGNMANLTNVSSLNKTILAQVKSNAQAGLESMVDTRMYGLPENFKYKVFEDIYGKQSISESPKSSNQTKTPVPPAVKTEIIKTSKGTTYKDYFSKP